MQKLILIFAGALGVLVLGASLARAVRNAWLWPFAPDSIWNLPVGMGAIYEKSGFQAEGSVHLELEYIVWTDAATPVRNVFLPYAKKPGDPYRAQGTTVSWLKTMRVPDGLIIPDLTMHPYSTPNACSAFVDGPTGAIIQLQPTTRLTSTGAIWGYPQVGENLRGEGITGTHYGSGLSVLGGSLRGGELTGTAPIRHALKILCQGSRYLDRGTPSGSGPAGFGWKWPADRCDDYARGPVSAGGYGGTNPEMAMGSLLALPGWMEVRSLGLKDPRSLKLAQALQDYGAYVVDDTKYPCYAVAVSQEAQADFRTIPQGDLMAIITHLWVVTNGDPGHPKGPGRPRAPLAPPLTGEKK